MGGGLRGFTRRGLVEDLAEALGCSVTDLTGQPYLAPDRGTADTLAVLAEITPLLYDITLEHVPDQSLPVSPAWLVLVRTVGWVPAVRPPLFLPKREQRSSQKLIPPGTLTAALIRS